MAKRVLKTTIEEAVDDANQDIKDLVYLHTIAMYGINYPNCINKKGIKRLKYFLRHGIWPCLSWFHLLEDQSKLYEICRSYKIMGADENAFFAHLEETKVIDTTNRPWTFYENGGKYPYGARCEMAAIISAIDVYMQNRADCPEQHCSEICDVISYIIHMMLAFKQLLDDCRDDPRKVSRIEMMRHSGPTDLEEEEEDEEEEEEEEEDDKKD